MDATSSSLARLSRAPLTTLSLVALVASAGCSLARSAGDFTIEDAPQCVTVEDCPSRPQVVFACEEGVCAPLGCEDGFADCNGSPDDGCEANLEVSPTHCGGCAMACAPANGVGGCEAGVCTLTTCMTGFEDCDMNPANGCEADLGSAQSCGACAVMCSGGELCDSTGATPVCSATCAGTVCGESCVDTTSNVSHCGGCGAACDTTNVVAVSCVASACAIDTCTAGFDDCDADPSNGCEADVTTDGLNCGGCGVVCDGGTACVAGVCDPVTGGDGYIGHTCVVRQSGRVYCWGRNNYGHSSPSVFPRRPERPALITEGPAMGAPPLLARAVTTSSSHSCVIGMDGRLRCWGRADLGQLGNGVTSPSSSLTPVLVTSADSGFNARTFTDLDSGDHHSCAVDDLGGVWCWGFNRAGGTGRPTSETMTTQAARVPLATSARAIALGADTSCALMVDGTVNCWGGDVRGELGDGGGQVSSATPVTVQGLSDARVIRSIWRTFCVVDGSGALSCWGDNPGGALGPTSAPFHAAPIVREPSGVLEAWVPFGALCWRKSDGVRCAGRNSESQFGDANNTPGIQNGDPPVRLPALDGMRDVFAGFYHACGLNAGALSCWGASFEGQVARDTLYIESPVSVVDALGAVPTDFDALSTGNEHSCGIRTGVVHCWGDQSFGKSGDGGVTDARTRAVSVLGSAISVSAGRNTTCAIADAGGTTGRQAYCWGRNHRMQGAGAASFSSTPIAVDIPGGEEISVSTNRNHACAIQEIGAGSGTGSVWCWGGNTAGELGRDTGGADAGPGAVPGVTDASAVITGHAFTCAIRTGGSVSCWGQNAFGQLGDGTTLNRPAPVPVMGLANVVELEAGFHTICGRQSSGAVFCWGRGDVGQLGDGTTDSASTPVAVSTAGFSAAATSIAVGESHACAAYDDGNTRCWGLGVFSQLGNGSTATMATPQTVMALSGATQVSAGVAGGHTTCALRGDRSVACWGDDVRGATGGGHPIYMTPTPMNLP